MLSDRQSVTAVSNIARKYLQGQNLEMPAAERWVEAIVRADSANVPGWLLKPSADLEAAGPLAQAALNGMLLQTADPRLKTLAEQEVERLSETTGQIVDPVTIGAACLIGLALLSKVSYSEGKWAVAPGFPGLASVLDKVAEVLKNLPR